MKIGKTTVKNSAIKKGTAKPFTPAQAKKLAKTFNGMANQKKK